MPVLSPALEAIEAEVALPDLLAMLDMSPGIVTLVVKSIPTTLQPISGTIVTLPRCSQITITEPLKSPGHLQRNVLH